MRLNFISLSFLNDKEHKAILSLRNSLEIRKHMKNSKIISFEDHKAWLKNLSKSHKYYAAFCDDKLIGSVNFYPINSDTYEWGFYFDSKINPFTKSLCICTLVEKIFSLGTNKIISQVKKTNQNAYMLNKSLGFTEIKKENAYYQLELEKSTWERKIKTKLSPLFNTQYIYDFS